MVEIYTQGLVLDSRAAMITFLDKQVEAEAAAALKKARVGAKSKAKTPVVMPKPSEKKESAAPAPRESAAGAISAALTSALEAEGFGAGDLGAIRSILG